MKNKHIQGTLALVLFIAVVVLIGLLFTVEIPSANKDAFNILLGNLMGAFLTCTAFYFTDKPHEENP